MSKSQRARRPQAGGSASARGSCIGLTSGGAKALFVEAKKRATTSKRLADATAASVRVEQSAPKEAKSKSPVRTQQERRSEAEHRLLAAARENLARKGWAGMTLADVGEAAGYSRGLAGHYFGSKAGLLRAITLQINNSLMEEIESRPPSRPGLEAVISFVTTYLGRRDPHWTNTRVILILLTETLLEGTENAEQMVSFNASMFTYLEANVRIGIESGEIDPGVSPPIAAEFVIGTLRGAMLQRLVRGGEVGAAKMSAQLASLVRRSLSAAPPRPAAIRPRKAVRTSKEPAADVTATTKSRRKQ